MSIPCLKKIIPCLKKTKLLPLNYYKEFRNMCFMYKYIHGLYKLNVNDFIKFHGNSQHQTRLGTYLYTIRSNKCKTVKGAEFFFNRITIPWNNLSSDTKTIKCKNKDIWPFKNKLLKRYHQLTETFFQSDNICTWTSSCRCPRCRPD